MMINQPELECYGNLGDPARPGLRVKADSESESEHGPSGHAGATVPVARTIRSSIPVGHCPGSSTLTGRLTPVMAVRWFRLQ